MGLVTSAIAFMVMSLLRNIPTMILFFFVFVLARILFEKKNLPPGPWGLPLFGYLPYLGVFHITLHNLAKKYGSILSLSLGVKKIVVLSDPELIRQAFKREEFTGRPQNKLYDMFQGYGVINIAGDRWREQRRFLHEHLRALGMKFFGPGRDNMDKIINAEVTSLLQSLSSHQGKSVNADMYIKSASANVVCNLMMSVTFEQDSPVFKRFMELNQEGFQLFIKADIANYIPLFKYRSDVQNSEKKLKENRVESMSMLKNFVNKRGEDFYDGQNKDIIDAYLQKKYDAQQQGLSTDDYYDRQLLQVMCDLFSAGQETVYLCLNWCLIYLVNNPDVMKKVQEELDAVVGRSRLPKIDDMASLPYTEATICEILRLSSVVPLATPHSTTKDTYINQYFIPKGTTVFANLYSCHRNPDFWPEPDKFDPTRFLDVNGKVFKPKEFMPFGVGRRMCLGEVLARSEIFMFTTSILHTFDLSYEGDKKPSLKQITAVTTASEPYQIQYVLRKHISPNAISSTENIHARTL